MDVSIVSSSSVMVGGVDPSSSVIVDRGLADNAVSVTRLVLADALGLEVLMMLLLMRFLKVEELLIILLCCIVKA